MLNLTFAESRISLLRSVANRIASLLLQRYPEIKNSAGKTSKFIRAYYYVGSEGSYVQCVNCESIDFLRSGTIYSNRCNYQFTVSKDYVDSLRKELEERGFVEVVEWNKNSCWVNSNNIVRVTTVADRISVFFGASSHLTLMTTTQESRSKVEKLLQLLGIPFDQQPGVASSDK